jgi:hypothetical protein
MKTLMFFVRVRKFGWAVSILWLLEDAQSRGRP